MHAYCIYIPYIHNTYMGLHARSSTSAFLDPIFQIQFIKDHYYYYYYIFLQQQYSAKTLFYNIIGLLLNKIGNRFRHDDGYFGWVGKKQIKFNQQFRYCLVNIESIWFGRALLYWKRITIMDWYTLSIHYISVLLYNVWLFILLKLHCTCTFWYWRINRKGSSV